MTILEKNVKEKASHLKGQVNKEEDILKDIRERDDHFRRQVRGDGHMDTNWRK